MRVAPVTMAKYLYVLDEYIPLELGELNNLIIEVEVHEG
jgi:hypothetical protein